MTLGGRYNHDEKSLLPGRVTEIPGAGVFLGPEPGESNDWNNFSPKGSLEAHLTENSLLYFSVSKGFKAGSQQIVSAFTPAVNPETVLAYEVGGKHTLDDGRLRFNWAAFHDKYKDLQVDVIIPVTNIVSTQNAASATTYGIDWDLAFALTSQLRVTAGMEWLHAKYDSYPNAAVYVTNAQAGVAGLGNAQANTDASGNDMVNAPKYTANLGLTYSIPLPVGGIEITASDSFNNGFAFDALNSVRQGSYHLASARATYNSPDKAWSVYVYGNNLLNKEIISGMLLETFGDLVQYSDPRIVGAGVTLHF
jgi:iron complex outermembrane recepter protein